jgi:predicted CXXCH cytochrome family protein
MSGNFLKAVMLWAAAGIAFISLSAEGGSIVDSVHNLSSSGPGAVRATDQTEICIFCHIPHNARPDIPYLWNRLDPAVSYTPYYSSTLKAAVGQPTGASRLCLSCHDGVIAPGSVISKTAAMPFTATLVGRSSNLGTNLADDHPVSFDYSSAASLPNSQLANAGSLTSRVRLDASGQMQCTACHDPHNNQYGKFTVVSNLASGLCVTCHIKTNWSTGSHALSPKTWNGIGTDPWPSSDYTTVAANGCASCHRSHAAPVQQRLLNYALEETNCLVCHNGNVAGTNISAEVNKFYRHPVASYTGVHDAAESYADAVTKHVECTDCHNPHQVNSGAATPPLAPGRLTGVPGVTTANTYLPAATNTYQICYKCHGDMLNNVRSSVSYPRGDVLLPDNRLRFATSNRSFHPVQGPLNSTRSILYLLPPYTSGSMVYCTDCHNNDSTSGPRGPHGSNNKHILARRYETSEISPSVYDPAEYALCFGCHDQNNFLHNTRSRFPQHRAHITLHTQKDRCVYCHDPHGSQGNPGMINFDKRVVTKSYGTQPIKYNWNPVGNISMRGCVLTCHGVVHGP